MRSTLAAAAVFVAAALAPTVFAGGGHGSSPEAFEPLVFSQALFPAVDGTLAEAPPVEGAIPVPPPAGGEPGVASWSWTAPVQFKQRYPAVLTLYVRAEEPALLRDPTTGKAFAAVIARNGEELPETLHEAKPSQTLLAPGEIVPLEFGLSTLDLTFEEGDTIEFRVLSWAPQPRSALSYLVGGTRNLTTLSMKIQAPTLAALGLEASGHRQALLEGFFVDAPKGVAVANLTLGHGTVSWTPAAVAAGGRLLLVVRASEDVDDASHHAILDRAKRTAALHVLRIDGRFVETYPGTVLVADLKPTRAITIECARNCPQPGFTATNPVLADSTSPTTAGGTGSTGGNDAPAPERGTPLPVWIAAGALGFAAARRRHR